MGGPIPGGRSTVLVAVLWFLACVAGLAVLLRFETTPGPRGSEAPAAWPAESRIPPGGELPTLLLFLHPRCPCSRATLGELEGLMVRGQDRVALRVAFVPPEGGDLRERAARIPGAVLFEDVGGAEARRFHAATSGTAFLYDPRGRLRFEGGLTISRGHAGANPGRTAVESLISGDIPATARTPVFGCPLFGPSDLANAAGDPR